MVYIDVLLTWSDMGVLVVTLPEDNMLKDPNSLDYPYLNIERPKKNLNRSVFIQTISKVYNESEKYKGNHCTNYIKHILIKR